MSRKGKIARLPAQIRDQVCMRLHDGQSAKEIISWLSGLSEVREVVADHFDGESISPQNLSEWKRGGYKEWLARRQKVENLKVLSSYAIELAKAGGSVTDGAAAIAGGRILELLERLADDEEDKIVQFAMALAKLREAEAKKTTAGTLIQRLEQAGQKLALEQAKFQRQTAEMFAKWYKDRAAADIMESRAHHGEKMDRLVQLMFGDRPATSAQRGGEPA